MMSSVASRSPAIGAGRRVAYLMSRFPKISESFILYEIVALERMGLGVEIFPLMREREPIMHAEAGPLVERAHYSRYFSGPVVWAQLYWLRRRPAAYLRAWWHVVRGCLGSPGFLLRAFFVVPQAALFAQQMGELGISHVHAHYATHPALAAYVIKLLAGIPYSVTAHAHDIYVDRAMLSEKIDAASFVVTISDYNRRLLVELYGHTAERRTTVIHCGVDLTIFSRRPPRPRGERLQLISVASLQDYKGHRYLIEACARLAARSVPFRCLIVGEGEERPSLEALIRTHGLEEAVRLLGRQPRDRVSDLLARSDVMVMPSVTTDTGKREGIPVALMEALAVGLPVVATAISGIPELIEDGKSGLLVAERDPEALADALVRLYEDQRLCERLGEAGRSKVEAEFNLHETTAQLYSLLCRDWSSSLLGSAQ
jgi:colanic acid/amylovoran biosynthesis glycosyltransferase